MMFDSLKLYKSLGKDYTMLGHVNNGRFLLTNITIAEKHDHDTPTIPHHFPQPPPNSYPKTP